ncbi:MAG: DoxX family membrane protein [Rikenellaceae bacterium]|nr:DoxX family membrane protein [Rikenellaceae bacterium]
MKTTKLQNTARILLGTMLAFAGTSHLTFAREDFQAQVPDWVPMNKDTVVVLSGYGEIALGLALILMKKKKLTGVGASAFFAAVFPGNVSQYTHHRSAFGLDTDKKRFIRLLFQPVLIAWALYASGVFNEKRNMKLLK